MTRLKKVFKKSFIKGLKKNNFYGKVIKKFRNEYIVQKESEVCMQFFKNLFKEVILKY